MSEKKMPKESQLVRRNGRYSFRAHVPDDVKLHISGGKSGQKWIALGTSDRTEAAKRKRVKSVEFDQEIAAVRKRLAGHEDMISKDEAAQLAARWLTQVLQEDEDQRRRGLSDREWRKQQEAAEIIDAGGGYALARGDASLLEFEMTELLAANGLHILIGSESWNLLGFEMLKAEKQWSHALLKRQAGEIVETPISAGAVKPRSNGGVTISELIDAYLGDPQKRRTPSTLKTYRTVFRAIKELMGADTPANEVHRRDCERIRDLIVRLPKNVTQRFDKMPLEDAAKVADAEGMERIKPRTANAYLGNLSSLFKWGVRTWRVERNPAEGLLVHDPVADGDRRKPFALEQLRTIFTAPLYTGCKNDGAGYAEAGPNVIRRGRFWVPLLSLWTGMRLGECCQLHTADVTDLEGVTCILINDDVDPEEDEADRKRVKTTAGRRFVPVHPQLTALGFNTFVAEKRKAGSKRLFPELKPDIHGYLAGPFSKWFNDKDRFMGKLGLSGQNVSFHSFRHTYRDALREAGISTERVRALGGWSRDSGGEESIYGSGLSAPSLFAEIQRVGYPGLDLSHIRFD